MDAGAGLLASILGCQPVSAFSHLIAAGAALALAVPLVRLGRGCSTRVAALSVYVTCVVTALAVSGLYHSCERGGDAREIMQKLDHYAIWLLIAGTFTAMHVVGTRGRSGNGILFIIWGYAFTGITLQILWFPIFSSKAGLAMYLGLGWLGVAPMMRIARQLGRAAMLPILYAGVAFSGGALLERTGWPVIINGWVGAHEVFHFAVVLGCGILWWFIRRLLILHHHERSAAVTP